MKYSRQISYIEIQEEIEGNSLFCKMLIWLYFFDDM